MLKMTSQQKKRQRLIDEVPSRSATFDALSVDELALIFGYLSPQSIMCARLNRKMRVAATKTVVPTSRDRKLCIDSVKTYNMVAAMTTALPNLQQIEIRDFKYNNGLPQKIVDGDDPNPDLAASTVSWPAHNIDILSSFRKLRELKICTHALNGRYPMLFNFPLLQKLTICSVSNLKWDLAMLAGLPLLKELECYLNPEMTGNINSLSVLKGNLVKVQINSCEGVQGNLMDLADFPHLRDLELSKTSVTGDIRDIGKDDFLSLEELSLPSDMYGGWGYMFQRISDAPNVIKAVSSLGKRHPYLLDSWFAMLDFDSPEWYEDLNILGTSGFRAPLLIEFVKVGPRLGWRWKAHESLYDMFKNVSIKNACEVNWLDPEPSRESSGYQEYVKELRKVEEEVDYYKGFYQPPSESEYKRIAEERFSQLE